MADDVDQLFTDLRDGRWVAPVGCYGTVGFFVDGVVEGQPPSRPLLYHVASELYLGRPSNLVWSHTCLLDIFDRQERVDLHDCAVGVKEFEKAFQRLEEFLRRYIAQVGDLGEQRPGEPAPNRRLVSQEGIHALFQKPVQWMGSRHYRDVANYLSGYSWTRQDVWG